MTTLLAAVIGVLVGAVFVAEAVVEVADPLDVLGPQLFALRPQGPAQALPAGIPARP